VRKGAAGYQVFGFVLNDGTPLKSVEVSVDGGPWQAATLDKANTRFSWKLFTFDWKGDLVDRHGKGDGPEAVALSQDAQAYAFARGEK